MKAPNNESRILREAELIRRIMAGERDCFELLIEPYSASVLSVIRRKVRNDADADDVFQEVIVKAFSKLNQFRGSALFGTWLHSIAINEVRQHFRRQRSASFVPLSAHETELPSKAPHALATFEKESTRMAVDSSLAQMGDTDRKALVLFHIRELSVSETARELSMSDSTVKSRLLRARARLRKVWSTTTGYGPLCVPSAPGRQHVREACPTAA